ncbi:PAS domain-containing protein [Jannaschia sp. KMU-145]|uniref:PAS domain-containing protein n=1 Tax=Jannaschia halovivens TaxID=3388667 RepID=UPI00396AF38F
MLDTLSLATMAAVFDDSTDCVKLIDTEGRVQWMNMNGRCSMEIDDFDAVRGTEWALFWPLKYTTQVQSIYSRSDPKVTNFSAFCPTAKGSPRWWDVTVSPVNASDGAPAGFLAISRDVTERETAAKQMELMLAEMRHRQKNTVALTATLLNLHKRKYPEAARFARDMTARLQALMSAQETIGVAGRDGAYLDSVLPPLFYPLADPASVVSIHIEAGMFIPPRQVDLVSIIFGELAINASKHGALKAGGTLRVTGMPSGEGIELVWTETLPEARTGDIGLGDGLDLMNRIAKMNGVRFEMDWLEYGLRVTLVLPTGTRI